MINNELRMKSIGGSEIAAMLGLCPYQSPMELWRVKTGRSEGFAGNEHTERGKLLEPVLLELLNRRSKDAGFEFFAFDDTISRQDDDWLLVGTPDANGVSRYMGMGGAELKSTTDYVPDFEAVKEKHLPWVLQSQHCMRLTGRKWWALAWMHYRYDFQWCIIEEDRAVQDAIICEMRNWWNTYVVTDTVPPIDRVSDILSLYSVTNGNFKDVSATVAEEVERLKGYKAQIKALEDDADHLASAIKMVIGDHDGLSHGGRKIVTWKYNKANTRVFLVK